MIFAPLFCAAIAIFNTQATILPLTHLAASDDSDLSILLPTTPMLSPDASLEPSPEQSFDPILDPSMEPSIEPSQLPFETSLETTPECFPADASVTLEDGTIKEMAYLKIGERVAVGNGHFSDVIMFTHKLNDASFRTFVRLHTKSHKLRLTPGHLLYVNGKLIAASQVRVGDFVELSNGTASLVNSVDKVQARGLYNPQTRYGDIIVDGFRASTYTMAVSPAAAHALLSPVRICIKWLNIHFHFLEGGLEGATRVISGLA